MHTGALRRRAIALTALVLSLALVGPALASDVVAPASAAPVFRAASRSHVVHGDPSRKHRRKLRRQQRALAAFLRSLVTPTTVRFTGVVTVSPQLRAQRRARFRAAVVVYMIRHAALRRARAFRLAARRRALLARRSRARLLALARARTRARARTASKQRSHGISGLVRDHPVGLLLALLALAVLGSVAYFSFFTDAAGAYTRRR